VCIVHTGEKNNEPYEGKANTTTTIWRLAILPHVEVTLGLKNILRVLTGKITAPRSRDFPKGVKQR
jgi:hypothetical protein